MILWYLPWCFGVFVLVLDSDRIFEVDGRTEVELDG